MTMQTEPRPPRRARRRPTGAPSSGPCVGKTLASLAAALLVAAGLTTGASAEPRADSPQRTAGGTAVTTAQKASAGQGAQDPKKKKKKDEAAQEADEEEKARQRQRGFELTINERLMVIGDPADLSDIPGSAHFLQLGGLEHAAQAFDDIHGLLREVQGINIQEEDGYGLRPNIGLRGTGVERSSKITLMEDGVLIAPAPYAAASAYYFPVAGRMEGIEVRKGSSQVKYGPRTNGGAINLLSTSIPRDFSFDAEVAGGTDRTGRAHVTIGDDMERFGWLLETYQISTDGFKEIDGTDGSTGFNIQDYVGKLRINSDPTSGRYHELQVKLAAYRQVSDETYLGLTEADFRADPNRRYAASQQDVFRSDHQQIQARYFTALSDDLDLTAVAYRNDFFRNWYKLQSIDGVGISDIFRDPEEFAAQLAIARGADSAAGALEVRANQRDYYSQGVQGILGWRAETGRADHEVEFGVRYHEDQEDRFQHEDGFRMVDGIMEPTSRGAPGSQSNRISDADSLALFVQDRIVLGDWTVVPGVRFESIDLRRLDFATDDPGRTAPTRERLNNVEVFIPGVGISYRALPGVEVFGGIHKGFGPPGPGSSEFTDAEESVNYELGLRLRRGGVRVDAAGFFNDYSNLLGADTLSSGGEGTGNLFNGGEVRVFGFEASANGDLGRLFDAGLSLPIRASYTFTDARFENSFASDFDPWGTVEVGDELPYLPRHQLSAGIGLRRDRWGVDLEASYLDEMRTAAGQGSIPAASGTDSYVVLNLAGELDISDGVGWFAGVQNLTDRAYVVARRPAGARPGLPRTLSTGLRLSF